MQHLTPLLAEITWGVVLLAIAFVFVCLFMMMIILIQKPKGGGLSGAFGGAGGGESSFVGAKVGDVLTLVTVICFVAFLGLAMALTWKINPIENEAKADDSTITTTTTTAGDGEAAGDPLAEDESNVEGVASEIEAETQVQAQDVEAEIETFEEAAETVETTESEPETTDAE
ncbi:MAG: preprotein translocase subunit SecG [Planctomycetota bacterium]